MCDGEIGKLERRQIKEKSSKKERERGRIKLKESQRVSGMKDSLPGLEHIEGSRWKSGTVN